MSTPEHFALEISTSEHFSLEISTSEHSSLDLEISTSEHFSLALFPTICNRPSQSEPAKNSHQRSRQPPNGTASERKLAQAPFPTISNHP